MGNSAGQLVYALRCRFPAMLPRECLIMQAWLKGHETDYDRFVFELLVGTGADPGPRWDEALRRMWIHNTKKRIDAVAYRAGRPTIIEVKYRAGASAVGQLLTYRPLYEREYPEQGAPRLMLLTNSLQTDILPVLEQQGIDLQVQPVDFSVLANRLR